MLYARRDQVEEFERKDDRRVCLKSVPVYRTVDLYINLEATIIATRRDRPVNVTELRQNLPAYLEQVGKGEEIEVTSRGKVIARIVAGGDPAREARDRLLAARPRCFVGDVVHAIETEWDAER